MLKVDIMRWRVHLYNLILIAAIGATMYGCSFAPLQPWERDLLAKPEMQLTHPFDTAYAEHTYFSKEASSGGQGFTAGGCGCN